MPENGVPQRPNLVFILPDRLRRDSMACYGNDWIQSPHLNALAEQSFVFENAYVTQPVCAPARSSILTGLYPPTAGMPVNRLIMPSEIQTIAQMVSDEYKTGYVGKWHLGDEIFAQRGFEEWVGSNDGWWTENSDETTQGELSDYHHFLVEAGIEPDMDHPGGKTFSPKLRSSLAPEYQMATFLGNRAAEFIERNADEPFVLYVSTIEPHPPFTGPYDHLYDPATTPVDDTFLQYPEGSSLFNRLRADFFSNSVRDGIDLGTEDGWRLLRSNYWGNVKLVDDMVGTIIDAVDRSGAVERTIVVFTSEHGDMVGTHRMLEMRTPYEEAARVPLLIRAPWLLPEDETSQSIGGNFSQIDFVPTFLELLGEPIPSHLQGKSRAGVLRGEQTLADNDVFVQHNGVGDRDLTSEGESHTWPQDKSDELNHMGTLPWRSVITADRWKLTLCEGDQGELYDLNNDASETSNLFDGPEHRNRIRRMTERLRRWQLEVGDTAPLPGV